MGRFSSDTGGGDFIQAPTGTHIARCIKIIDIGTQHGEYNGVPNKRNQIIVSWELPTEMAEQDGKEIPIITSRFYTNSLSEKANLRHDLEAWRGKVLSPAEVEKFDLENIIGKPCLVTVVEGKNGKTKVASVSGLPKGTECPPQVNKSFTFWLDDFDKEKFQGLSDGLQKLIRASDEFQQMQNGEVEEREVDDDGVPF